MKTQHSDRANDNVCPQCNSDGVTTIIQTGEYVYGTGESTVRLAVELPIRVCGECQFEYSDWEAEEIKHNALCQHFGVLNPAQIRQLRKKHKISRSAFAQLTGLGEASLNRWEKGINIQSISHDRFLRLLQEPAIFNQLRRTVAQIESRDSNQPDHIERFPNLKNRRKLELEQSGFALRVAG